MPHPSLPQKTEIQYCNLAKSCSVNVGSVGKTPAPPSPPLWLYDTYTGPISKTPEKWKMRGKIHNFFSSVLVNIIFIVFLLVSSCLFITLIKLQLQVSGIALQLSVGLFRLWGCDLYYIAWADHEEGTAKNIWMILKVARCPFVTVVVIVVVHLWD